MADKKLNMSKIIAKSSGSANTNNNKDALRERIYGLIKTSTGNNYVLGIPQAFIKYTGSLHAAVFLSQMIHWTPRATRADGFVFKKNAEWFEETGLKRHSIGTATKTLTAKGILKMKKEMAYGSPTWHYKLDTKAFEEKFREFIKSDGLRKETSGLRKSAGVDVGFETQLANDTGGDVESNDTAIAVRQVSDIEAALRSLIQNIPPTKTEEDALRRLCEFVENGTYTPDDIAGCAKWILKTFDMITVKPTSIEDKLPTYLAKKGSGVLDQPRYESNAQRSDRINRERNSPEGKARQEKMREETVRKMMAEQMGRVEATKQFQIVQSDGLDAELIELGKRNLERREAQHQEFERKKARQEAEKELIAKQKEEQWESEQRRAELHEAERTAAIEWATATYGTKA